MATTTGNSAPAAPGISHTVAAIRTPAETARRAVSSQPCASADRDSASIWSSVSPSMAGVKLQSTAAKAVPARLAASTMAHSRIAQTKRPTVGRAITGSTTVIVLSVNNCWRASTTITKPIG
jgi:hypothetical protein